MGKNKSLYMTRIGLMPITDFIELPIEENQHWQNDLEV